MRKIIKKQLLELLGSIEEALETTDPMERAADLLGECQSGAVAIGTEIQKEFGEDFAAATLLQNFSEELYQFCLLEDMERRKQADRLLIRRVREIRERMTADISVTYEILFLPYKASMWDALDSIYRAAVTAPNVHVTVLPVPYWNISRGGAKLKMEYEGSMFPLDIPITYYKHYEIADARPDAIFIHNPYDETNLVTRLPEQYYSSVLARHTDRLIYVPYFVTSGSGVNPAMCNLPGTRNAWLTVCQSEEVRQCYIKAGVAPEKTAALGSPKFDMVHRYRQRPPEIPDHWKQALSGRKVFLLNTHLSHALSASKDFFHKLRSVFAVFHGQKDIALIWRPHPLFIETIRSVCPHLLGEYLQLAEEFQNMPNAVYDTSGDMHLSIALSDAYIGDQGSSVPMLYGMTGKPVYYFSRAGEHPPARRIEEERRLWDTRINFSCAAVGNGRIFAPMDTANGIVEIDPATGEGRLVTMDFNRGWDWKRLFQSCCWHRGAFYFAPWSGLHIMKWAPDSGKKNYFLPDYKGRASWGKYRVVIPHGKYVYFFPNATKNLVRLNVETEKIVESDRIYQTLSQQFDLRFVNGNECLFSGGICDGNTVWLTMYTANAIVAYSLATEKISVFKLHSIQCGVANIIKWRKKLMLMTAEGDLLAWDLETHNERVIPVLPDGESRQWPFRKMVLVNDVMWILPNLYHEIMRVSLEHGTAEVFSAYPPGFSYLDINGSQYEKFWETCEDREYVYICPRTADMLLKINKATGQMTGIEVHFFPEDRANPMVEFFAHRQRGGEERLLEHTYCETLCSLTYFVQRACRLPEKYAEERRAIFEGLQANGDGSAGEKIWEFVFGSLRREDAESAALPECGAGDVF